MPKANVETRNGEQYYTSGTNAGKKVGTVRGQGGAKPEAKPKSKAPEEATENKHAHAREAVGYAAGGDWDKAWKHAQEDPNLKEGTTKEDWVKWASSSEHFKNEGGHPNTAKDHMEAHNAREEKEAAKAEAADESKEDSEGTEVGGALSAAIKDAEAVAPEKKVNEREQQEIGVARSIIQNAMPKPIQDMSWDEFKPWGVAIQKQSSWGQPESFWERGAKFEWDWAQKNLKQEPVKKSIENEIEDYAETLSKSFESGDEMLSKSGAGSRGGKIVGTTKSGKPIYASTASADLKHLNADDHTEAAQLFRDKMAQHNKAGDGHLYHGAMAARDTHKALAEKKKLNKSNENTMTPLQKSIQACSKDQLQELAKSLNTAEKQALLSEIETLRKGEKAVTFDDVYSSEYTKGKITDTEIQEDDLGTEQEEKIVKPASNKQKHQGDESPEGKDGQLIKGNNAVNDVEQDEMDGDSEDDNIEISKDGTAAQSDEKDVKDKPAPKKLKKSTESVVSALAKSLEAGVSTEALVKSCVDRGISLDQANDLIDEALEKSGAGSRGGKVIGTTKSGKPIYADSHRRDSSSFSKEDHSDARDAHNKHISAQSRDYSRLKNKRDEGKISAKEFKSATANMLEGKELTAGATHHYQKMQGDVKKSLPAWEPEERLLKAHTLGRNFSYNVGDHLEAEALAKSEANEANEAEPLEKSIPENPSIQDMIENGLDESLNAQLQKSMMRERGDGALVKSFSDSDMNEALGLGV